MFEFQNCAELTTAAGAHAFHSYERLSPIRFSPTRSSAGEHPVIVGLISGVLAPSMQCLGQAQIKWNRLL